MVEAFVEVMDLHVTSTWEAKALLSIHHLLTIAPKADAQDSVQPAETPEGRSEVNDPKNHLHPGEHGEHVHHPELSLMH